jgi:hypothetical protein
MKRETAEIEYIFGKHAAREVLLARPDIVKELYVAADFFRCSTASDV